MRLCVRSSRVELPKALESEARKGGRGRKGHQRKVKAAAARAARKGGRGRKGQSMKVKAAAASEARKGSRERKGQGGCRWAVGY